METLFPPQAAALNLGLLVVGIAGLLAVVWLGLQIIGWFSPRETYATKSELLALEVRLTRFEAKFDALNASINKGFADIERAIGKLEGRSNVP
jgi:hypothetical protein